MFKFYIFTLAALTISVNAGVPTADEAKSEMLAAGVSDQAATGVIAIADKYKSLFEQAKSDREAGKEAFASFQQETEAYMKTQSAADQTAYSSFVKSQNH